MRYIDLVNLYYRALHRDPSLNVEKVIQEINKEWKTISKTSSKKISKTAPKTTHEEFIVAYGKDYCPYSNKARDLLDPMETGVYIEMTEGYTPHHPSHLTVIKKAQTIPIVFVGSRHVGGYDDLVQHIQHLQHIQHHHS